MKYSLAIRHRHQTYVRNLVVEGRDPVQELEDWDQENRYHDIRVYRKDDKWVVQLFGVYDVTDNQRVGIDAFEWTRVDDGDPPENVVHVCVDSGSVAGLGPTILGAIDYARALETAGGRRTTTDGCREARASKGHRPGVPGSEDGAD